ncbi:MAG: acetolactate synthase small subunit [Candidatus Bathyarchaeia archaeon]
MVENQTHIISALVEHKPGVLYSVSNMFRRRGFNIESITVGPAEQRDVARMTIVVNADERVLDQVVKQLNKLVDVIKVSVLNLESSVVREMALVKVHAPDSRIRSDLMNYVNVFRGHTVDISPDSLTVEVTGDPDKIRRGTSSSC